MIHDCFNIIFGVGDDLTVVGGIHIVVTLDTAKKICLNTLIFPSVSPPRPPSLLGVVSVQVPSISRHKMGGSGRQARLL